MAVRGYHGALREKEFWVIDTALDKRRVARHDATRGAFDVTITKRPAAPDAGDVRQFADESVAVREQQ